jgi:hypothetical protein
MNNHLIIRDLTYLDEVTENGLIGGGTPVAITTTMTTAGYGSTSANAVALASGQYIAVGTQTQVITGSRFNSANALAEAYALSGNSTAVSLSSSNATSVTNPYSSSSNAHSVSFSSTTAI